MTMKDKILHYFRDINYAYNDCTKFDILKAALEKMGAEKVGHWEYIQYDKPPIGNWHCSECGRIVFLLNSQKSGEAPLYDFCPWCGVKMQEVEG